MLTPRLRTLLVVLAASVAVQAQQTPALTGTGLVLGRVVDGSTGQPVPAVTVVLNSTNRTTTRETALTGADGQFVFMSLPADSYNISTIKSGYLDGAYGRTRPGGTGVTLHLQSGQRVGDIKIQMWRPATISGHVVDASGKPMIGVSVVASHDAPSIFGNYGGSGITDEHGDYRIARLTPGAYTLRISCLVMSVPIPASAGAAAPNVVSGNLTVDETGHHFLTTVGPRAPAPPPGVRPSMYVTTFYPGTTREADATTITVASGEEHAGADFVLASRPSVRVSGTVIGPNGPVAMAMVRLWQPDIDVPPSGPLSSSGPVASAVTANDGSFLFLAAPTGDFVLDTYRPQPPIGDVAISPVGIPQLQTHDYIGTDREGWTAKMSISITSDTHDVAVTMLPKSRTGASVSGTVVFDRMMTFSNGRPLDPFVISLESNKGGGGTSGRVRADAPGPFVVEAVQPGRYELHAGALLQGFAIVSATLNGRDLLGAPLEVGPSGLAGLAIRIGDRLNAVSGKVTDAHGQIIRDAGIALFPTDENGWAIVSRSSPRVVYHRAGADTYSVDGFPDGEYFLVAVDDGLMASWPSPALLKQLAPHAIRIDVRGGVKKTQDLSILKVLK